MLCDASILALPKGPYDFVGYCDASKQGFGCVLMQRNKLITYTSRQLKIHEKNYTTHDLEFVADALSIKEWMKPRRVWAVSMTIHSNIKAMILEAQIEASKDFNTPIEMLRGLDKQFVRRDACGNGHDVFLVIVDRLTKSAYFLAIREDYKMERFARLYINEIVARHERMGTQLHMSTAYHPQTDGQNLNLKFLRSVPSEWNTHVVVWRNKSNIDRMSFDDLYINFKIVEQEVKGIASSSSSTSSQNIAFVSSPSITNEVNTAYGVSADNTQVSTAST
nr:putative reverse transcriptase domain-containing protein [Tanacetum cinerariifolium]